MFKRNKPNDTTLDYETVYRLTSDGEWERLVRLMHDHGRAIDNDDMLLRAFNAFESTLVAAIAEGKSADKLKLVLPSVLLLNSIDGAHRLSESGQRQAVLYLVQLLRSAQNLRRAVHFAQLYPDEPACAAAIAAYNESLPKSVPHSQAQTISVTVNRAVGNIDYTISLFKSQQEEDFFDALCSAFPMQIVYPNVALSTVIDFDKLRPELTNEEREYFLRAVVDCVVVNPRERYKPLLFFELDSHLHDADTRIKNDRLKDTIFAKAGQRLLRVRRLAGRPSKDNLLDLINEVVDRPT